MCILALLENLRHVLYQYSVTVCGCGQCESVTVCGCGQCDSVIMWAVCGVTV